MLKCRKVIVKITAFNTLYSCFLENVDSQNKDIVISRYIFLSLICILFCFSASTSGVEVIAHKAVAQKSLSVAQLRRIYTMRQVRWPDKTPIKVFVLPSNHALHQQFTQSTLNILPYKLDRIWNKLTFSGLGVAPTIVATPELLLKAVSATPGALGYVEKVTKEDIVNVIQISQ